MDVEELARLTGLHPDTLKEIVAPSRSQGDIAPPSPPVIDRMGRRTKYVPLTETELACLGEVFRVGPQAVVDGSVILNGILAHAAGATWASLPHGLVARQRLRRSALKREFATIAAHVRNHPHVFSAERVAQFEEAARMEAAVIRRSSRPSD